MQELLEVAKGSMPVPFRPDGPRMAYYFDSRPLLPREEAGTKRKLVVDNYEVEPQPDGGFQAKRRPVLQRVLPAFEVGWAGGVSSERSDQAEMPLAACHQAWGVHQATSFLNRKLAPVLQPA